MPPNNESPTIMLEGVKLLFRNLSGLAKEFNAEGERNFSVVLEPETAEKLKAAGWRVKQLKPREEDEAGDYHMKVKVNYRTGRPPHVVMITSSNRTDLGADEVSMLDVADLKTVDVILNGYWSDMAGGGYQPYLKTMFATINEDELEMKYREQNPENPDGDE